MVTVKMMMDLFESLTPKATSESWDNVGLMCGSQQKQVDTLLLAMDLTPAVITQATMCKADMIFVHHPPIFEALSTLENTNNELGPLMDCIKKDIAVFCAHTNLDRAFVLPALCQSLGLNPAAATPSSMELGAVFHVSSLQTADLLARIKQVLDPSVLVTTPNLPKALSVLALSPGAGGSELIAAKKSGAQVLITGEVKHSTYVLAQSLGLGIIACGHHESEWPGIGALAKALQKEQKSVKYIIAQSLPVYVNHL